MFKSKYIIPTGLFFFLFTTQAFAWNPIRGDFKWDGKVKVKDYHYCVIFEKNSRTECHDCTSSGLGGEAGKVRCANSTGSSGDSGSVHYGTCRSERNKDKCEWFGDKGEYNFSYKK